MRSHEDIDRLTAALADLDKNVRIKAALALGEIADPAVLPALLGRLGVEPDFYVRDTVIWAIVRMGETAVTPVIALLDDADKTVRYYAAHTLSKLADSRAVDPLLRALNDSDEAVSQKAVFALGQIRDTRALPALTARIGTEVGQARSTLHDALQKFGEAAVPSLATRLVAEGVQVRVDVIEIVAAVTGRAVLELLAAAAADRQWEVRFAAVNALRGVSDPLAKQTLIAATEDAHQSVRVLATRLVKDLT